MSDAGPDAANEGDSDPVTLIRGSFVDELVTQEVAAAMNTWFKWMMQGSEPPPPAAFEQLGVDTENYAWKLGEDVDWQVGPHARAVELEVRISLETYDTHFHLAGLLKRLGALRVQIERSES